MIATPDAEFIRVQDTDLAGKPDTLILEWAARHGYVVLTHDAIPCAAISMIA